MNYEGSTFTVKLPTKCPISKYHHIGYFNLGEEQTFSQWPFVPSCVFSIFYWLRERRPSSLKALAVLNSYVRYMPPPPQQCFLTFHEAWLSYLCGAFVFSIKMSVELRWSSSFRKKVPATKSDDLRSIFGSLHGAKKELSLPLKET